MRGKAGGLQCPCAQQGGYYTVLKWLVGVSGGPDRVLLGAVLAASIVVTLTAPRGCRTCASLPDRLADSPRTAIARFTATWDVEMWQ